jgi:16S rRNA C1402 (ribose-2'-O) methylase RsmI
MQTLPCLFPKRTGRALLFLNFKIILKEFCAHCYARKARIILDLTVIFQNIVTKQNQELILEFGRADFRMKIVLLLASHNARGLLV